MAAAAAAQEGDMAAAIRGARDTVSTITAAVQHRPQARNKRDSEIEAELLRELHDDSDFDSRPASLGLERLERLQDEAGQLDKQQQRVAQAQQARVAEENILFQDMQAALADKSRTISDQDAKNRELQARLQQAVDAKAQAEQQRDDAEGRLGSMAAELQAARIGSPHQQGAAGPSAAAAQAALVGLREALQAATLESQGQQQTIFALEDRLRATEQQQQPDVGPLRSELSRARTANAELVAEVLGLRRALDSTAAGAGAENPVAAQRVKSLQVALKAMKAQRDDALLAAANSPDVQLLDRVDELEHDCAQLAAQNEELQQRLQALPDDRFVGSLIDRNMRVETFSRRTISNLELQLQAQEHKPTKPTVALREHLGTPEQTQALLMAKQHEINLYKAAAHNLSTLANALLDSPPTTTVEALRGEARHALGLSDTSALDTLPRGWELRTTPEGIDYFVDHTARRSSWLHPQLEAAFMLASNAGAPRHALPAAPGPAPTSAPLSSAIGGAAAKSLNKLRQTKVRRRRRGNRSAR